MERGLRTRVWIFVVVTIGLVLVRFLRIQQGFQCLVMHCKAEEDVFLPAVRNTLRCTSEANSTWPAWTYDFSLQPWLSNKHPVKKNTSSTDLEMKKRLPTVICIGVKKCGTQALQYFLQEHPRFKTPLGDTEGHFFDSYRYHKGIEYYRWRMSESGVHDMVFEKSPRYFFSSLVPGRIKDWNKDVKIILLICDPAQRAFSDFHFVTKFAPEYRRKLMNQFWSFEKFLSLAIKDLNDIRRNPTGTLGYGSFDSFVLNAWNEHTFPLTVLTNGMYYNHLKHWLAYFPPSQIHIVDGDKLISDPAAVLVEAQKFMGLQILVTEESIYFNKEKGFYCLKSTDCLSVKKGNTRGSNGRSMSVKSLQMLSQFYKPFNQQLFDLLGQKFNWM